MGCDDGTKPPTELARAVPVCKELAVSKEPLVIQPPPYVLYEVTPRSSHGFQKTFKNTVLT